jgi:hypothetical protein
LDFLLVELFSHLSLSDQRRWPSGKPSFCACCRNAVSVRFIDLDMFGTGVLLFEWDLKSRLSSLVQARSVRFFAARFVVFTIVDPIARPILSTHVALCLPTHNPFTYGFLSKAAVVPH